MKYKIMVRYDHVADFWEWKVWPADQPEPKNIYATGWGYTFTRWGAYRKAKHVANTHGAYSDRSEIEYEVK